MQNKINCLHIALLGSERVRMFFMFGVDYQHLNPKAILLNFITLHV